MSWAHCRTSVGTPPRPLAHYRRALSGDAAMNQARAARDTIGETTMTWCGGVSSAAERKTMSLRKPPPAANSSSGTRVSRRGVTLLLAAVACVLVVWLAFRPRVVTTPSGVRLGHLPPGVHPSDLNLLLVTLDTTRADRLGAYGFTAGGDAEPGSHRSRRRPVRARRLAGAPDAAGTLVALHQQVPAVHMACATTADSFSASARRRWPSG